MNPREELKAYADRELTPEQMRQVEEMLARDPSLQTELSQIEAIGESIRREALDVQPVGLENVLERLQAASQRRPWWTGWPRMAAAAACLVVFGAILFPVLDSANSRAKNDRTDAVAATSASADAPAESSLRFEGSADMAAKRPLEPSEPVTMEKAKSAAPAAPPSVGGDTLPPQVGLVIRNGSLTVRVQDAEVAQKDVIRLARELGGYVEDSNLFRNPDGMATASVLIRVPERRFESGMESIARIGEVENRSVTGQDVTSQVVDMDARVKTLRAEEEQYRTLLKATQKIGDILIVKDRLSQVRMQIESLDAQRKHLRSQAAYSSISATFTERPKAEGKKSDTWVDDAWNTAVNRLGRVGEFLGKGVINAFVFAPVWLPLFLLAWWGARRMR